MLTVVTAIFGPGFKLYEPADRWPNCRFICFTDQEFASESWEIVEQRHGLTARRSNRHVKALIHRYVDGPTFYLDAEFKLTDDPHLLIGDKLDAHCWAATRHPDRDCIYKEAAYCIKKRCTISPDALRKQITRYRQAGMPRHFGLWAGGILARRGDEQSRKLGESWWSEIEHGAERDQVSLAFMSWRLRLPPGEIPGVYSALPGVARRKRPAK